MKRKNLILAFLLAIMFVPIFVEGHIGDDEVQIDPTTGEIVVEEHTDSHYDEALVFYNEACTMCSMYIMEELIPSLKEAGIKEIIKKDYVNEKQNRVELNQLNEEFGVPPTLQGHFMVFVDGKILFGGHVPKHIIMDLLSKDLELDKLLVLQDEMGDAESYFAWGFKGEVQEYQIDEPISHYITWFNENKDTLKEPEETYKSSWNAAKMLPLVISTGFLDGFNPCAFAVLLFFIMFLFTIHRTKRSIWKMGLIYILGIFIAYFLIGLGLLKAFIFTGTPHLMAKIGAFLLIGLGIINLANYLLPDSKFKLGIPTFSKEYIKRWLFKATLPAALIAGFLVGLCTFPCSGGMYVAVVGLLATKSTYMQGLMYLVVYNVMFVAPLFVTLVAASNRRTANKIKKWQSSQNKVLKLVLGVVMILLGLAILFWFI